MKVVLIFSLVFLFAKTTVNAQPQADSLARKIAKKMKDTLNLTGSQRNQIYNINMNLHQQKAMVRQQHTNMDSLRRYIQRVENKRDSLYRTVLPENKYQLYKQKKRNLVSAN